MAKDKKKKAGPLKKEYKKIGREFRLAGGLAERLGINADNDRLDTSREEAAADPNSPSFVGLRSDQTKNYIEGLQNQVENAGKRSEELRNVLGLMAGGLAGLNSQENQALRETAQAEMNRNYQASVRSLQEAQAKSNVFGASRTAQLQNERRSMNQQKSDFERDLMVKNIDIQDQRRKDYLGAVQGAEGDEWARTTSALDKFGGAVRTAEGDEQGKTALAQGRLQDLNMQNINLKNQAKGANLANMLGITGFAGAKKGAQRQYDLAKEGLAVQREQIAAGKEANNAYINSLNTIYGNSYGSAPGEA